MAIGVVGGCAADGAGGGRAADDAASPPSAEAAASRGGDGKAGVDYDDLAAEMARYLGAGQAAGNPALAQRAAIVRTGRFVNHTDASAKDFEAFREAFVGRLKRAGRRHGLLIGESETRPALGSHELHVAVVPLGVERRDDWLVRLVVVGQDATGHRRALWSETLRTAAN